MYCTCIRNYWNDGAAETLTRKFSRLLIRIMASLGLLSELVIKKLYLRPNSIFSSNSQLWQNWICEKCKYVHCPVNNKTLSVFHTFLIFTIWSFIENKLFHTISVTFCLKYTRWEIYVTSLLELSSVTVRNFRWLE